MLGRQTQERSERRGGDGYLPLADYGLIGDCHSAALVSRRGSIDWCCLPRFDSDSCFGRLLDRRHGGHFSIAPRGECKARRSYIGDSLILATTFEGSHGKARLVDFFAMRRGGRTNPRRELVRLVEGLEGEFVFDLEVVPRFDYGATRPWIKSLGDDAHFAVGGDTGLVIRSDLPLQSTDAHGLAASVRVASGERRRIALTYVVPHELDDRQAPAVEPEALDRHYEETRAWWDRWASRLELDGIPDDMRAAMVRSALVLKALSYAPSGALIAAPTTSLPEHRGGDRNWDYRYSWLRDSAFTVHTMAELGCVAEADGFRRFVERSAAGNARELQAMYGIDGKHRLPEITLEGLEGWCRSRPVRHGNAAAKQLQGDMYGLVLELSWRWAERGNSPTGAYWQFLSEVVEMAIEKWKMPDHGIWEIRSSTQHFVQSKVMCWAAVDRGLALAATHGLEAPAARWRAARAEIHDAVMKRGVDAGGRHFVRAFGSGDLDASLLLLPQMGFVPHSDPRMCRTTEAIRRELSHDGLIRRYQGEDEGTFLPCSFWLAESLAGQGQLGEANEVFGRASLCANDLGLYAEEYDPETGELLGNFPQGLTHLAQLSAARAIGAAGSQGARIRGSSA